MTNAPLDELLAAYETHLRGRVDRLLPAGVTVERDGPLVRYTGYPFGGYVDYRDLGGLAGADLDRLIARQVAIFAERREPFEWKSHTHDRPSDLADRLRAAGLVPDDLETVMIGRVDQVAKGPGAPLGVDLREVSSRSDLERIAELERVVWEHEHSSMADFLEGELAADPEGLTIVVAEADARVVSAAWVRFVSGTPFATLWGGATLREWRRRGIYRSLVAYRARLAARRGCSFLEVEASDDSRPILERLGFVAVATSIPYNWTPPSTGDAS